MTIRAVTFDLWDTMVHDDSDEAKRAAQGLRSKRDERRHLVWAALNAIEPIDLDAVNLAYDTADAGFNVVWKELFINWTVEQRLRVVLNGLGRTLPDDAFAKKATDATLRAVDELVGQHDISGSDGRLINYFASNLRAGQKILSKPLAGPQSL